jgi:hypothetical protein
VKFELKSQMNVLKLWNKVWAIFIWPSKLDHLNFFESDVGITQLVWDHIPHLKIWNTSYG